MALETAAARHKALGNGASVDVPESLKPFIVSRPRSPDMLDVAEAAVRLEISSSTVYNWMGNRKLLAWKPAATVARRSPPGRFSVRARLFRTSPRSWILSAVPS